MNGLQGENNINIPNDKSNSSLSQKNNQYLMNTTKSNSSDQNQNEHLIITEADDPQPEIRIALNDSKTSNSHPPQKKDINRGISQKGINTQMRTSSNMVTTIIAEKRSISDALSQYKARLNSMNNKDLKTNANLQRDTYTYTGIECDIKSQKGQHLKNLFKLLTNVKPILKNDQKSFIANPSPASISKNTMNHSLENLLRIILIDELDPNFKINTEEGNNNSCLIKYVLPYIFDNLKRRNKLKSIVYTLFQSSYLDKELKSLISEKILISCLVEIISDIQTQVYLGSMLKINDYPVPLAFWMLNNNEKFEWKINFKLLYDILGNNKLPIYLNMGTSRMKNSGKTSLLRELFEFHKDYLLIESKETLLPTPSIDVYPALLPKRKFIIFDVHGFPSDHAIYQTQAFRSLFKTLVHMASVVMLNVKPKDLEQIETNEELKTILGFFEKEEFKDIDLRQNSIQEAKNSLQSDFNPPSIKRSLVLMIRDIDTDDGYYDSENIESKLSVYTNRTEFQIHKLEVKNLNEIGEYFLKEEMDEIKNTLDLYISNTHMKLDITVFDIENHYLQVLNAPKYPKFPNEIGNITKPSNTSIIENIDYKSSDIPNLEFQLRFRYLRDVFAEISKKVKEEDNYDPLPLLSIMNKIYNLELEKNEYYINIKQNKDTRRIDHLEDEMDILKDSIQDNIMNSRLIEEFIMLTLAITHEEFIVNLIRFEGLLDEWKRPILSYLKTKREEHLKELENENNEDNKQLLLMRINEHNNKIEACNITIDKLWDEIMLIYHTLQQYKSLSAYHNQQIPQYQNEIFEILKSKYIYMISNGFPIHLARGSDIKISNIFLDQIIQHIDIKQNVYIISVIGIQSSAKSTLLNYLFGSNFAVSAGRCTRGMYISLVKTIKNQHILIIDTEGLMSTERKDEIFDRQMALISFACSNLVIINHNGDISRELNNLLQTVLYAMKHIKDIKSKPRILFILRDQVDRTSKKQDEALTKIRTNLEEIGHEAGLDYKELIDIDFENLILLPSAFINDMNNEIFSNEVLKLRRKIILDMEVRKQSNMVKFKDFFNNIKNLWDIIVKYGKTILDFNILGEILMKQEISQICDYLMKECHRPMIDEIEKAVDEYIQAFSDLREARGNKDQGIPPHLFNIIELKKKEILDLYREKTNNKFTSKLRNYYQERLEYQFTNFDLLIKQLYEIKIQKLKETCIMKDLNREMIDNMDNLLSKDNNINEELIIKQNLEEKFRNYAMIHLRYLQEINPLDILDKIIELFNFIISTKYYENELYRLINFVERSKIVNYYQGNSQIDQQSWILPNYIISDDANNTQKIRELLSAIDLRIKAHIIDKVNDVITEETNYDVIYNSCNLLTEFYTNGLIGLNTRMINNNIMFNDISYMFLKQMTHDIYKKRKARQDEELKNLEKMKQDQLDEYLSLFKNRKDSKLTGENLAQRIFTDIKDNFSLEKTSILKEQITKKFITKFPDQKTLMDLAYKMSFEAQNVDAIYKYCVNVNSWISEIFDLKYNEICGLYFNDLESSLKYELDSIYEDILNKMKRWKNLNKKQDKFILIDLYDILGLKNKEIFTFIGENNEYDIEKFSTGFINKFESLLQDTDFHISIYENIKFSIDSVIFKMKKHYLGCQARCPLCKNKCMEIINDRDGDQPHDHDHKTIHLLKAFGGTGTVQSSGKKIPSFDYCISKASYEKSYYHPIQSKYNYNSKPKYKDLMSFIEDVYPYWKNHFEDNKNKLMKSNDEKFEMLKKIKLRRAWMKSRYKFLELYNMVDEYPSKWKNLAYWEDNNSILKFN